MAKVILPEGMLAYDLSVESIASGDAEEEYTIGANKCRMEWTLPDGQAEVRSLVISFDDATGISDIVAGTKENRTHLIYNIVGQRLNKLQKGLNIVNGRKIMVGSMN